MIRAEVVANFIENEVAKLEDFNFCEADEGKGTGQETRTIVLDDIDTGKTRAFLILVKEV